MSGFTTDSVLLAYESELMRLDLASGAVSSVAVYPATPPFEAGYSIAGGGLWRYADAGAAWFLSNGKSLVLCAHTYQPHDVLGASVTASAMAVNDTRLFFGGMTGDWFLSDNWGSVLARWRSMQGLGSVVHADMGTPNNMVFWSGLGGDSQDRPYLLFLAMLGVFGTTVFEEFRSDILAAVESGMIGMHPMTTTGPVIAMLAHGNRMNVYGQRGVAALDQMENGRWAEVPVTGVGIKGRGAVAGSPTRHLFVDNFGELRLYQLGEGVRRLGYRQLFSMMDPEKVLVSYDPLLEEYWISDGTHTYVLTSNGLGGPITTAPTGLVRDHRQRLIGVTANAAVGNKEIRLKTNGQNMSVRDPKHMTLAQFSMSGITGGAPPRASTPMCRVDWKGEDGLYREGVADRVNADGVGFPHTSFTDGRLVLEGWSDEENARIWDIQVRFNTEGRSYIRGTAPSGEIGEDV